MVKELGQQVVRQTRLAQAVPELVRVAEAVELAAGSAAGLGQVRVAALVPVRAARVEDEAVRRLQVQFPGWRPAKVLVSRLR